MIHGKIFGHGTSSSGRYAKITAAKMALEQIENLSLDEFRRLTGCDCEPPEENSKADQTEAEAHGTAV